MTKGMSRSTTPAETVVKKHVYRFDDFKITNLDGASGNAWGAAMVDAFPMGFILVLGAVLDVKITDGDDVLAPGVGEWTGQVTVASSPASAVSVNSLPGDIIPPGRGDFVGGAGEYGAVIKATSTGAEGGHIFVNNLNLHRRLWLNIRVDDAGIETNDVELTVNGTLTLIVVEIDAADPVVV